MLQPTWETGNAESIHQSSKAPYQDGETYIDTISVSYTHLRAHETPEHLVCRLLLEKKKTQTR